MRWVYLLITGVLLAQGLARADDPNAPVGSPGWKVEVVHEQPKVNYCSVVCCAPDGRVFLAEDPMDMLGPPDVPSDRILCIHPDGKITLFADKLYAVFGLAYVDGKLYVHHCPRFSVFDDGGTVGRNRVDLIECTNPRPWNFMNDHIPANIRLGMDGWFYMAVGDKGIYGAVGKDGSKAELHGGGILRFRPDGTCLEVFCTGTRNHLDVAINAEDDLFTYDNSDDGLGWNTRLMHMIDGGFYGYPFDYKPPRPYALPMMGDYGGGSPTGGLAYNEDALPLEYRGNLFMCEWGKSQLVRFVVEREAGSYKAVRRDVLASRGVKEFRPIGVDVSADGMGFYLADWNFARWTDRVVKAGRLIKVTYTGPSQAAPKPAWYIPAAQGQRFDANTQALVEALRHPAQRVRLVALRRVAERGPEAVEPLGQLLRDAKAPSHARWAALWALDRLDEGRAARRDIIACLDDADLSVRRQAARQLGTRRAREAVPALLALLRHEDRSLRLHAATALGRMGDPTAANGLIDALADGDAFSRYAAFTALNRIGRAAPASWPQIATGLQDSRAAVREGVLLAFRETYETPVVAALTEAASDGNFDDATRSAFLVQLGELAQKRPAWKGEWWGAQPARLQPPARSERWDGSDAAFAALAAGLKDPAAAVRQGAALGLVKSDNATQALWLVAHLPSERDPASRKVMLEALSRLRNPSGEFAEAASKMLVRLLADDALLGEGLALAAALPAISPALTAALLQKDRTIVDSKVHAVLLEALAKSDRDDATQALEKHARGSAAELKSPALRLLATRPGETVTATLLSALGDPAINVRKEAVLALGKRKDRLAIPALLAAASDKGLRFDATLALGLMPDARALELYLEGLGSRNGRLREECGKALTSLREAALPRIEARLRQEPPLPAEAILQLQKIYADVPEARQSPLFKIAAKTVTPAEYAAAALAEKGGNAERGRALFLDLKGAACIKCHRAGGDGGDIGPDLRGIASRYTRVQLAESILYPSKQIFEGYHLTVVETKRGQVFQGILRGETAAELTLVDAEGRKVVLKTSDIESRARSDRSMMPDGLQTGMTILEFADLVSYLETLRE